MTTTKFIEILALIINSNELHTIKCITPITFFKAYELTAQNTNFGGLSGIVFNDKEQAIMISDKGIFIKTTILQNETSFLSFNNSSIGAMQDSKGLALKKQESDTEEIAYFKDDCFVSHEVINYISYYKNCDFSIYLQTLPVPKKLKTLNYKAGMEGLGISNSGQFFAIAEYNPDNNKYLHIAALWKYSLPSYETIEEEISFYYESSEGYGVSSLTFTDKDNVLVMERKYKVNKDENSNNFLSFETKIKFIPKVTVQAINEGSIISGKEIIYIFNEASKYSISDNFEAISSKKFGDQTSILLLSDDNMSPKQKTILLQFNINESNLEKWWNIYENKCILLGGEHIEMDYDMILPD